MEELGCNSKDVIGLTVGQIKNCLCASSKSKEQSQSVSAVWEPEELWNEIKEILRMNVKGDCQRSRNRKKANWMSEQLVEIAEKRSQYEN